MGRLESKLDRIESHSSTSSIQLLILLESKLDRIESENEPIKITQLKKLESKLDRIERFVVRLLLYFHMC